MLIYLPCRKSRKEKEKKNPVLRHSLDDKDQHLTATDLVRRVTAQASGRRLMTSSVSSAGHLSSRFFMAVRKTKIICSDYFYKS